MMKIGCSFIMLLWLLGSGCSKKDPVGKDEFANLSYHQTYCSDPWAQASVSDSITLTRLKVYLDQKEINVLGAEIHETGHREDCKACSCKTGKVITVSTFNSKVSIKKLEDLGITLNP